MRERKALLSVVKLQSPYGLTISLLAGSLKSDRSVQALGSFVARVHSQGQLFAIGQYSPNVINDHRHGGFTEPASLE